MNRRAVAIAVIVGVLLVALALREPSTSAQQSVSSAADPAMVAGADVSAWYCAEGTSNPGGRADETVLVANLGGDELPARMTVYPGGETAPGVRDVSVPAHARVEIPVAEVLAVPEPGVVVETFGPNAFVEHRVRNGDDVAVGPCTREAGKSWSFAGATTAKGARVFLALLNPFGDDATVDISFVTDAGSLEPQELQGFVVPRQSRVSVPVHESVRRQGLVAATVHVRNGRVVAEQSMLLDGGADVGGREGLAVTLGASGSAEQWQFPWAGAGLASVVQLANPGARPAEATLKFTLEGDATLADQTVSLPPRSVTPVDLTNRVAGTVGLALEVHADQPIVAELVVSGGGKLASVVGQIAGTRRVAFAVPLDSISISNPDDDPVRVTVRDAEGKELTKAITIRGRGRAQVAIERTPEPVIVEADREVSVFRVGGLSVSGGVRVPD